MKIRFALTLLSVLVLALIIGGRAAAAVPSAPTPLAPTDGASVLIPFTITWSAVNDPTGIVAYNWEVSRSSSFTTVILQDSTSGEAQDAVSGLATGTYFWRVQAVNGDFVQGAWSQPRSFNVTGVGPGAPGTPSLNPPVGYSTFHPWETMSFTWSAVPNAASYVLHASTDPNFPATTRIQFDNIPTNSYGFAIANPEGNYYARVFAVSADGIASAPSNVITFSVFYNNPVPPPPSLVSPTNGPTLTLPITLTWNHVLNPQPSGYEVEIAKDSRFSTIEEHIPQLNGPSRTVLSLTSGTKYWRVRSHHGNASPTTSAVTAWSATGTFTVSTAPPTPVSLSLANDPIYSADSTWVAVQLTAAAPSGGATIGLTSSDPGAAPVPATISMPGNTAWTQFMMQTKQVTSPTPVTLTATLNGGSASVQFVLLPASLKSISTPSSMTGGTAMQAIVMLNGQAPPAGAIVRLTSDSPAASPPADVMIPSGSPSAVAIIPTSAVTTSTPVTITATWNGVSVQSRVTLTPQQPPTALTLDPTTTVGTGGSSTGLVTVASAPSTDLLLPITSSHPAITRINTSVMIPAGTTRGSFNIFTSSVTAPTLVTISVSGAGVTKSATLTVNPDPQPTPTTPSLASLTLNPTSVVGGNTSQGTVTLSSGAPSGGAVVSLSSANPALASVPANVTVPAGATTAKFTVTSATVNANTSVTLTATYNGVSKTASLTVTPPSTSPLPAPSLLSPANDARFSPGANITFDWTDVSGAATYSIQIDDDEQFSSPQLVNQNTTTSQFSTSSLPSRRMWWRVRTNNASGTPGTWSVVRRFEVKN